MSCAYLSASQRDAWHEDGWCVIPGAIPSDLLVRAQAAASRLFPTIQEMDADTEDARTDKWRVWDADWPMFPFPGRSLNTVLLHDRILDLAEDLLGGETRMYQGVLTAKFAGQPSGFNQLLHVDYPNNSLVVPRRDQGYQQLEIYIYLSDVDEHNGATRMVSRRHTADIPVGRHTLNMEEYASLYEEPGIAHGPAGSVVAYRPDVYHRSVDWNEPGRVRMMLHAAFKSPMAEWAGYQAWPFRALSADWYQFVQRATLRQLVALGFPAPGHSYWTQETLAGVADRYPTLDLDPWRKAPTVR